MKKKNTKNVLFLFFSIMVSTFGHLQAQTLEPLYSEQPGAMVLRKNQSIFIGDFLIWVDTDASILLKSGTIAGAVPKEDKQVKLILFYTKKWKNIRSAPYWEQTFDEKGQPLQDPTLVAKLDTGEDLLGPCLTSQGQPTDKLIIGRITGGSRFFYLFDPTTPDGEYPLKNVSDEGFKLPSARQSSFTQSTHWSIWMLISVIILAVGIAVVTMLTRRRSKQLRNPVKSSA